MTDVSQLPNLIVVALTIYGEARGEPVEGQIAVAQVIRNRALRAGHAWRDICLAPRQFSCWNDEDPNRPQLDRAADTILTRDLPIGLAQALWIAEGVRRGAVRDNTHGAHNYLATSLLQSEHAPTWALGRPVLAVIGNHSFLNA